MDNKKIAKELVKIAKELMAADVWVTSEIDGESFDIVIGHTFNSTPTVKDINKFADRVQSKDSIFKKKAREMSCKVSKDMSSPEVTSNKSYIEVTMSMTIKTYGEDAFDEMKDWVEQ